MMIDAHIASFLTGFFLEPDAVSERRQLVELIVLSLIRHSQLRESFFFHKELRGGSYLPGRLHRRLEQLG